MEPEMGSLHASSSRQAEEGLLARAEAPPVSALPFSFPFLAVCVRLFAYLLSVPPSAKRRAPGARAVVPGAKVAQTLVPGLFLTTEALQ